MAATTDKGLRGQVMYQIFVRNFSETGRFSDVLPALDRIKALGTDIIWFAPIHPIGEISRKGSLGSPYAIRDYRAVNPEYGSLDDFKNLVDAIHARGMRCIIDVVYNHTAPDSVLAREHPEWFYRRADGSFGNRVGDWTDVIDLDYSQSALWDYQIETLRQWAGIVDGFRCDVAPMLPLEFWKRARQAVEAVRPGCLWLSESVEPGFILALREMGIPALSDSEIYEAFDLSYEYDVYGDLVRYLTGEGTLAEYAAALNRQEYTYPDNYVKLRFLENHDQVRAAFRFPGERALRSATAFLFFQKGLTLLYAGQEYGLRHLPSLFDRDPVCWDSPERTDLSPLIQRLSAIKRDPLFSDSAYTVKAHDEHILIAKHSCASRKAVGVFPLDGRPGDAPVPLPDGEYRNEIDGSNCTVRGGLLHTDGAPVIIMQ